MPQPIRMVVIGYRGRMGAAACGWIRAEADLALVGEVEKDDNLREILKSKKPDVALDFTTASVARTNSLQIIECGVAPVIGTSGLSPDDLIDLRLALEAKTINNKTVNAKNLGGIVVPNFSIGAVLAMRFAEEASRWFSACEVIEAHHATKADAPSGTARATAERAGKARGADAATDHSKELIASVRGGAVEGVRVHSIRMPGVIAHQETWFGAEGETLKITHDTTDRACFRSGVLLSLRRAGEISGLVVGLESLLFSMHDTKGRR
ncbi:MAG: 4-hydroxy-tetrahydrodipicolinate reductase [Planctomycetota bacterium]